MGFALTTDNEVGCYTITGWTRASYVLKIYVYINMYVYFRGGRLPHRMLDTSACLAFDDAIELYNRYLVKSRVANGSSRTIKKDICSPI